jgi:hypothetical protein
MLVEFVKAAYFDGFLGQRLGKTGGKRGAVDVFCSQHIEK